MNELSHELWLPIVGYEGLYSVSNLGKVRSEGRVIIRSDKRKCTYPKRIMKACPNPHYLTVSLTNSLGITKTHHVHLLVLVAFGGHRPNGLQACHNNGNKLDNSSENLRWGTTISNAADKKIHGTINIGERNGSAKLTAEKVLAIRARRNDGLSFKQLGIEFGISHATAHRATVKQSWGHI